MFARHDAHIWNPDPWEAETSGLLWAGGKEGAKYKIPDLTRKKEKKREKKGKKKKKVFFFFF